MGGRNFIAGKFFFGKYFVFRNDSCSEHLFDKVLSFLNLYFILVQLREAVIVFAAENRYGTEADLQQLRVKEDETLFVIGLQELLKACGGC
jgi:hypothetical protein